MAFEKQETIFKQGCDNKLTHCLILLNIIVKLQLNQMNMTQVSRNKENHRKKSHSIFGKNTNKIFTNVTRKESSNQNSNKAPLEQVNNNISFCPANSGSTPTELFSKISKYPYLQNASNVFYKSNKKEDSAQNSNKKPKFESIAVGTSNIFVTKNQFIFTPNSCEIIRKKTEGSNNQAIQTYDSNNNLTSFGIEKTQLLPMENGFIKLKHIQNLDQFKKSQSNCNQHEKIQSQRTIFRDIQEGLSQECGSDVFHSFMDPKHKEIPFEAKVRKLENRIKDLNRIFDEVV